MSKVPNRILLLCKDKDNLSQEILDSLKDMRSNNPDTEFNLFQNSEMEQIMKDEFPEHTYYFEIFSDNYYTHKTDLFRALWVNKYGGMYLDIKSHIKGSFSDFFDLEEEFCAYTLGRTPNIIFHGNRTGTIQNGVFSSIENSPILEEYISEFQSNVDFTIRSKSQKYKRNMLLSLFGVFLWTRICMKYDTFNRIDFTKYTYSVFNDNPDNFSSKHREIMGLNKTNGKLFNGEMK